MNAFFDKFEAEIMLALLVVGLVVVGLDLMVWRP
jgi:hypothetical protein